MAERLDAIAIGSHARPMSEKPKLRAFYEADSLHTEIYDALGASLVMGSSVEGDTDFYRRLAGETGGPILEVGCGTGRWPRPSRRMVTRSWASTSLPQCCVSQNRSEWHCPPI